MPGLSSAFISLIEKVVPERWMKRYELFIYSANIGFLAAEFLVISLLTGIIGAMLAYMVSNWIYALVTFFAAFLGMAFGYPYWRISKRTEEMERMLSHARRGA